MRRTESSETATGKRDRAPDAVVANSGESQENLRKQCCVADLHVAFVAEKEVAKGRAL